MTPDPAAPEPHSAPESVQLDEFDVGRKIGEGSSATVHIAVHRILGGQVALKRWRESTSESYRRRFDDECRLQWQLSEHPNIVRLYWADAPAGRPPWMAMELFDLSLADRLARSPAPDEGELVRIVEDLLTGLAAIHGRNHLHRDVKPANVLLKQNHAALGDLGLSMALQDRTADRAAGTGSYVAPELVSGAVPDFRSDVYSAGRTVEAAFGRGMPTWLDSLIIRATSANPDDRPQDAADFLNRFRQVRPAATDDRQPVKRRGRTRFLHPARSQVIAVAAIAVMSGVPVTTYVLRDHGSRPPIAAIPSPTSSSIPSTTSPEETALATTSPPSTTAFPSTTTTAHTVTFAPADPVASPARQNPTRRPSSKTSKSPAPLTVKGRITSPAAEAEVTGASQTATGSTTNLTPDSDLALYCVVQDESRNYFPYTAVRNGNGWSCTFGTGQSQPQTKERPFTVILATATPEAVGAVQAKQKTDPTYNTTGMGPTLPADFTTLDQVGIHRTS
ncbi:MAG TPA: serine/threonine-protein kinase [Kineosporiaceae bacterium]|nr:serine/threonine-protein kinase [Kineosporiaceae bacterium]